MKQPLWQASPALHTLPAPQPAPAAREVQAEALAVGEQNWQALAGLAAPAA